MDTIKDVVLRQWNLAARQAEVIVRLLHQTGSVGISDLPKPSLLRPSRHISDLGFRKFLYYWDRVKVNPSDTLRSIMIEGFFEYADPSIVSVAETKAIAENHNLRCINKDRYHLLSFVEQCIEHAISRPANGSQEGLSLTPRYFTITGAKGAGKTFLQNFIVTSHARLLNEYNVVWVRVNLVRDFHVPSEAGICAPGIDLDLWINAQIAKVLCRYYDPESNKVKGDPTAQNTRQLVRFRAAALASAKTEAQRKHIESMLDRFYGIVPDSDLHYSWINPTAVKLITQHATAEGLTFIVVIDGLDLLSHSPRMRAKYSEAKNAVCDYLSAEYDRGMFHLVFLREESLEDFQQSMDIVRLNPFEDQIVDDAEYCVIAPDIHNLYVNRIKTFTSSDVLTGLGLDLNMIRGFDEYVKSADPSGLGEQMRRIEERFGSNTRSAVQLLHSILYRYLQSGEQHKYHLTEMMMLGRDSKLPIQGNTYALIPERMEFACKYRQRNSQNSVYDTNFLPVIFHYPFDESESNHDQEFPYGMLTGVRILQTLRAWLTIPGHANGVAIQVLMPFLENVFNIPPHVLTTVIHELLDYEVVAYVKQPVNEKPRNEEERPIKFTPKGERLLDADLYDLTYLFLSAYSSPLPVNVLNDRNLLFPYSYPPEVNPDYLAKWVAGKIHNGFLMANLIEKLDHEQRLGIASSDKLDNVSETVYRKLLDIGDSSAKHNLAALTHKMGAKVVETAEHVLLSIVGTPSFEEVKRLLPR